MNNNHIFILLNITHISFIFFLIIIVTIFFPQQSHSQQPQSGYNNLYSSCKDITNSYNCGNLTNIFYPFWGQNRHHECGAGNPFYLNCNRQNITTILLYSQNFKVLDINTKHRIIKLKITDLSQKLCSPQFSDTYFSPTLFQYLPNVNNITIYYNCPSNSSYYYSQNSSLCGTENLSFGHFGDEYKLFANIPSLKNCEKHIKVPVGADLLSEIDYFKHDEQESVLNEGFEVKYNVNKECLECFGIEEGGCLSNDIYKHVELCYYDNCPDGSIAPSTHCSHKRQWNWKGKLIAGIVGAAFVGLSICITVFCFKYKSTKNSLNIEAFFKNHEAFTIRRYKFSHIKEMTKNFKVKLGQGGYGSVYKGKLLNDSPVAVKILNASRGNGEEFINEVSSITKTSHVNVVALLGFCFERRKKALIYELMSNGSLDKYIYNNNPESIPSLSWEILYEIAKGIARGLEYLHRGCSTRILHFDIKPHNILLDENFCPKISDFGLARLCPKKESIISISDARGTMGYVAPEMWNRNFGGVSYKSDVYSYGMMLLEMVGGRKNVNAEASQTSEIYFPHWVYKRLDLGTDLRPNEVIAIEEDEVVRRMTIVGLWCIQTFPNDRPKMSRVIEMLEGNISSLEIPPKPMLSSPTRSRSIQDSSTS